MSGTGLITLRRQQRRIEPGTECLEALSVTSGATADLYNKQPALLCQARPEQSQSGLVRCDCYWQEQQRLKFSGKPLEPENQEGLVVWTEIKHCLYTVVSDCLSWQQGRIRRWERQQHPSLAEELIAAQNTYLEWFFL